MYLIRISMLGCLLIWVVLGAWANPAPAGGSSVTADAALKSLTAGNARYVAGASADPRRDQNRRCETVAGGQHPIAAILACADSRLPVEMVFDQGIGDVFVVRVAGNVADRSEIGTLEYGVGHLGIPLIVVLGHSNCGAVTAAVEKSAAHGSVAGLLAHIAPAADKARAECPNGKGAAVVGSAIRLNVWQSIEDICTKSEDIRAAVKAGKVKIVGGVYDLHSGVVEILGEHPQQAKMLGGELKVKPALQAVSPAANPAGAGDHGPAKAVAPAPAKGDDHGAGKPAEHGPAPAKAASPGGHSQESDELIRDAAQAAGPTTQPAGGTAAALVGKKSKTFALAGLITGSAVLSLLVVHIVRTHR